MCKAFPVLGALKAGGRGNMEREREANSASELLRVYKGVVKREMVCVEGIESNDPSGK